MAYVEAELPAPLGTEYKEVAWAVPKFGEFHRPIWIARPKVTDYQVKFEMLYCGTHLFLVFEDKIRFVKVSLYVFKDQ